jgi:UDP-N-acetylglucosamine pyrophosphorylase
LFLGYQQASSTVGPIDVLSSYGACQPCTTAQMQNDINYQQKFLQFDSMETKKIQIKSQPREKFLPRTQNERKSASHYIRCEQNSPDEYPSIYVCFV